MDILILLIVGVCIGGINIIAGGGSLISLPLLIFLGVPPTIANATNRVGIAMQNVFAVYGFHQKGVNLIRFSLPLATTGILGAIIGARMAVEIPDYLFKTILAVVMVIVVGFMLFGPTQKTFYGEE